MVDNVRSWFLSKIQEMSEYTIDPTSLNLSSGKRLDHWNLILLTDQYLRNGNALLLGEPGFVKTTAVNVMGAVMTGLPLDFFSAVQIQGHQQQTIEEMLARPNLGALNKGEEQVFWQAVVYSPLGLIDEITRLPQGKRAIVMEAIRTGRINYLNESYFTGKKPWFATANPGDDGSDELKGAFPDRFNISLEFGFLGSFFDEDIQKAISSQNRLLSPEKTQKILSEIRNGRCSALEMYDISGFKESYNQKIASMPFEEDKSAFFYSAIKDECNSDPYFGRKRISDRRSAEQTRSLELASCNLTRGVSERGTLQSLRPLSQMIAYMTGSEKVTIEHIRAAAPYALSHRLEFSEDFRAKHAQSRRRNPFETLCNQQIFGEMESQMLTRKLLEGIEKNFCDTVNNQLNILAHGYRLYSVASKGGMLDADVSAMRQVAQMLDNLDKIEHPTSFQNACVMAELRMPDDTTLREFIKLRFGV